MKDLVLYTWTMLIAMDQNLCYGDILKDHAPFSLTTMDALTVMMWESAVSQVHNLYDFGGLYIR